MITRNELRRKISILYGMCELTDAQLDYCRISTEKLEETLNAVSTLVSEIRSMFTNLDPWVVDVKGGVGESSYEISVLRDSNDHGKRSYGWADDHKIMISSSGGPCHDKIDDKFIWDGLVDLAYRTAEHLNNEL